jgi:hypothetical protein
MCRSRTSSITRIVGDAVSCSHTFLARTPLRSYAGQLRPARFCRAKTSTPIHSHPRSRTRFAEVSVGRAGDCSSLCVRPARLASRRGFGRARWRRFDGGRPSATVNRGNWLLSDAAPVITSEPANQVHPKTSQRTSPCRDSLPALEPANERAASPCLVVATDLHTAGGL